MVKVRVRDEGMHYVNEGPHMDRQTCEYLCVQFGPLFLLYLHK